MKRWLAFALLFALGMASGAAFTGLVVAHRLRHPLPLSETAMRALTVQLHLDRKQRATVRPVVEETRERLIALETRTRPEVESILATAERKIRAVLRPDQERRFDRLLERRRRQRSRLLR